MRHMLAAASAIALLATPALADPSADSVIGANRLASGGDAWNGKRAVKTDYAIVGMGMTGTGESRWDIATGRFVDSFVLGPISGAQGYDGTHGWAKDQSGTITTQDGGDALVASVNEAYRNANIWWHPDHGGAKIDNLGRKSDGGANYDVLNVLPRGGEPFEAWFDAKTHLLARVKELQGSALTTSTYSDYRAVDGVELAYKVVNSTGNPKYDQTLSLTAAVFLPTQDISSFEPPKVTVADFAIVGGAHETTIPFQLINNHIYAPVKINGRTYVFIFDTGGVNAITPAVAKELGLKMEGHLEARGAGSGTLDAGFAKVATLEVGDASIKGQTFFAVPFDSLSNVEGVDEKGMVGFETFRRFVTRIDYGARTITLVDQKYFDPKDAGTAVHITFDGNIPEVDGSYDGIAGKFMIDTGARTSLVLTVPFVEKNGLRVKAKHKIDAVTGWGVGGPTRSTVERGSTLMIGTVAVASPITELSTDKGGATAFTQAAGNIGAGVLKRFVVTFDYEHNTMFLKPVAGTMADLDAFDRAGMWINRDAKGFAIVDVTSGAPASEAGLKAGDIITAVDGKPASSLELSALRLRLRDDAAGTAVTFTIERQGKTSDVKVVLRDLV